MAPERIHDRKSIGSGKLLKPYRHFGPLGLVLVFEKNESLFPFLCKDPFPPLREIAVGIIGAAQAQVNLHLTIIAGKRLCPISYFFILEVLSRSSRN